MNEKLEGPVAGTQSRVVSGKPTKRTTEDNIVLRQKLISDFLTNKTLIKECASDGECLTQHCQNVRSL